MPDPPSGTLTFLFTDLESSTRLWEQHPDAMQHGLALHDEILRAAIESAGGYVFSTMGDGMAAAFMTPREGVTAAVAAQLRLGRQAWEVTGPLRVRMALHTGPAELRGGDYFGPTLNRCARLMATGHGGQILVSGVTEGLVNLELPADLELVDLGEHRLRDLSRPEHVFQVAHQELQRDFMRLRSLDADRGNLPVQPTSFVGRISEVERVARLLTECRVVSLTGVGGVGKTRLGLQCAAEVAQRFRDGAWFCELAPVRDTGAIVEAVAAVFGVMATEGKSLDETLVEFLRSKQLLLVLDNCEHLLDPVAALVGTLAGASPELVSLATSRERLGVPGEQIVALSPLDLPDPGSSAESVA
ncbi:MAG: adenylate/guanylate cyclase domain-containing protein, partial [Thermoplasmata archaeon]|nr:adenylate/guanylate cyclase domain-containing protein [Thermoplasmata archaeon]